MNCRETMEKAFGMFVRYAKKVTMKALSATLLQCVINGQSCEPGRRTLVFRS